MQFARDPLPLSLALIEATVNLRTYLLQAIKIEQPQQHDGSCPQCRFEPWRLVICGQNNETPYSRSRSPHAIVVAGQHLKGITTRCKVGKESMPPNAGVHPALFKPLDPVSEFHPLRNDEAQRRYFLQFITKSQRCRWGHAHSRMVFLHAGGVRSESQATECLLIVIVSTNGLD